MRQRSARYVALTLSVSNDKHIAMSLFLLFLPCDLWPLNFPKHWKSRCTKTIILTALLYWHETSAVSLREDDKLHVYEKKRKCPRKGMKQAGRSGSGGAKSLTHCIWFRTRNNGGLLWTR